MALSAAHSCLGTWPFSLLCLLFLANKGTEASQLKLALRILEAGAQRLDALERAGSIADQSRVEAFKVEYFTLRARLVSSLNDDDDIDLTRYTRHGCRIDPISLSTFSRKFPFRPQ